MGDMPRPDCLILSVMDGAVVETGAMVARGAGVAPGKRLASGQLWAGVPARPARELRSHERAEIGDLAHHYRELVAHYRAAAGIPVPPL